MRYQQGDLESVTRTLVAWTKQFHVGDPRVGIARRWRSRLELHLHQTLPLIRASRLAEPPSWRDKLLRLSEMGNVLVHGDPAGSNVLIAKSDLLLLDPPGALQGIREADIGQICWHIGGPEKVDTLVHVACAVDNRLNPDAVAAFAGFNLIIWAGYALVDHHHPDRPTNRGAEAIEQADAHLRTAAALLQDYRLY